MLQALLEERFHLVAHRETKELPIYALVGGEERAQSSCGAGRWK